MIDSRLEKLLELNPNALVNVILVFDQINPGVTDFLRTGNYPILQIMEEAGLVAARFECFGY